ncbi:MAG: PDC sensor domain-containing protein, partial [Anaeroplasmataceae bacterium]
MSLIMFTTIFISIKQFMCRGKDITTLINKDTFSNINNRITEKVLLLESLGNLKYIKDKNIPLSERALSLKPFQEKYNFLMVALMDKDGNTSSSLLGGHANLSDRDYFKKVKSSKQNFISDVIISRTTGDKNVVIVHPILDSNNNFDGAIFVSLFLNDLINLNDSKGTFGKGYCTNILDKNLNLIAGDFDGNYKELKKDFIINEDKGVFFKVRNYDLHFIAFTKKHFSKWYIVTDLNLSKYFFGTIIRFIIIIILFLILFFMIIRRFDQNKQFEINPLIESLKKDRLTGIYNRHHLEESIDNYFKNKLENKKSVFI